MIETIKEILTPREAAEYLGIHVQTIYRLLKNGEIPGRKVGGVWRFRKDVLDRWMLSGSDHVFKENDVIMNEDKPKPGSNKDRTTYL